MLSSSVAEQPTWADREFLYHLSPSETGLADLTQAWLSAKAVDPRLSVFNFSLELAYQISLNNPAFAFFYLDEFIQGFDLTNLAWLTLLIYSPRAMNDIDYQGLSLKWPSDPAVISQLWQVLSVYWMQPELSESAISSLRICFDRHIDCPIKFDALRALIADIATDASRKLIHDVLVTHAPPSPVINDQVYQVLTQLELNPEEIIYLYQNMVLDSDNPALSLARKGEIHRKLSPLLGQRSDILAYLAHQIEIGGHQSIFDEMAASLFEGQAFSSLDLHYIYFRIRAPLIITFPISETDTNKAAMDTFISIFREVPGLVPAVTRYLENSDDFLEDSGDTLARQNLLIIPRLLTLESRQWTWLMLKTESYQQVFTLLEQQTNPSLQETTIEMPWDFRPHHFTDWLMLSKTNPKFKGMLLQGLETEPLPDTENSEKILKEGFSSIELYLHNWIDQKIQQAYPCDPLWIYMHFIQGIAGNIPTSKGRLKPPESSSLSEMAVKKLKNLFQTDAMMADKIIARIWLKLSANEQQFVLSISKQLIASSLYVDGAHAISETTIPWLYFASTPEQSFCIKLAGGALAFCEPDELKRALRLLRAKRHHSSISDLFDAAMTQHPVVRHHQLEERLYIDKVLQFFKDTPSLLHFGLFNEQLAQRMANWVAHNFGEENRSQLVSLLNRLSADFRLSEQSHSGTIIFQRLQMLALRWPSVKRLLLTICDSTFTSEVTLPLPKTISAEYDPDDPVSIPPIYITLPSADSVKCLYYDAWGMPEELQPIILSSILNAPHLDAVYIYNLTNPSSFFEQWHAVIQVDPSLEKNTLFGVALAATIEDQAVKDWLCQAIIQMEIKAEYSTVRGKISLREQNMSPQVSSILCHLLPELLNNTMLRERVHFLLKNTQLVAKEGIMTVKGPLPFDPEAMLALEAAYEREKAAQEEKEKNKDVLLFSAQAALAAGQASHTPGPIRRRRKSAKKRPKAKHGGF